jgi:hypothetical protein
LVNRNGQTQQNVPGMDPKVIHTNVVVSYLNNNI